MADNDGMPISALEESRQRAAELQRDLPLRPELAQEARDLVGELRNKRLFGELDGLAEVLDQVGGTTDKIRRLHAQAMIELGRLSTARRVLIELAATTRTSNPAEWAEAMGLQGRASKQMYVANRHRNPELALKHLNDAIEAYRIPYDVAPISHTWHGVNLVALLSMARREKLTVALKGDPVELAKKIVTTLSSVPAPDQDVWHSVTLAEAALALPTVDWRFVARHLAPYVWHKDVDAFNLASTLRQFTEIWNLDSGDGPGAKVVMALAARLSTMPGGRFTLDAKTSQRATTPVGDRSLIEIILGSQAEDVFSRWTTGLELSHFVGAVHLPGRGRIGVGFLVRAGDLGVSEDDDKASYEQFFFLTRREVWESLPAGALTLGLEIVFEAEPAAPRFKVERVVYESPEAALGFCLLQLKDLPRQLKALPLAEHLAPVDIYDETSHKVAHVIQADAGPGFKVLSQRIRGHDLTPPSGIGMVYYYGSPDDKVSPGSPLLSADKSRIVALHRCLDDSRMRHEGIWMQSIADSLKTTNPSPALGA
jgi:hypothetical protein